jgi:bifunctional non-homologous end joining protein LigD
MASIKSITLYYKKGTSDKVYAVQLEGSATEGYRVNAQNGRRGESLRPQNKTPTPVTLEEATKIYDNLVKSKLKDGYTPGEDGAVFQSPELESRFTGITPQLLNPIKDGTLESYLTDPAWCAQEKFNGWRNLNQIDEKGEVTGINRKGLSVALPLPIADALSSLRAAVTDGERMGETYQLFDLLEVDGENLRTAPYRERLARMAGLLGHPVVQSGAVRIVPTAYTEQEKRALHARVLAANGEGIVFKKLDAPYSAGRPESGGDQMKLPFRSFATVKVVGHTKGKRSAEMAVYDEQGAEMRIGKVTIPVNASIPAIGALLEVEYLYAHRGGSLFSPVYQFERKDVGEEACTVKQLKFKPDTSEGSTDDEG